LSLGEGSRDEEHHCEEELCEAMGFHDAGLDALPEDGLGAICASILDSLRQSVR